MKLRPPFLALPLLILTISCGNSPRVLQSVTATPASADAKNFPNGRVQFTPTGTYNTSPKTVTPLPVTAWLASSSAIATIDPNGVAECVPGQVGTVQIQVGTAGDHPLWTVAQLTCP
jgi:hypothetical protein